MRLVMNLDAERRELDLVRHSPHATLGDVVAACGGPRPCDDETIHLDREPHQAGDTLGECTLMEGTTIARSPLAELHPTSGWTVAVAGGLDAGLLLELPHDRPLVLGRSPQADLHVDSPSTSWTHLSLVLEGDAVRVRDEGSTNGTLIHTADADAVEVDAEQGFLVDDDAVVIAGGCTLRIHRLVDQPAPRPGSLHNLTPAGTAPFNRPPRPGRAPGPAPIPPPSPREISPATRFSILMVAAPLVMAVGMVVMMRDPRYVMFAVLTPVMALASWGEQKQRNRREHRDEQERFENALEDFREAVARAGRQEGRRRLAEVPDPATTLRRALLPDIQLWQRRWGHHDFLALHAGTGDIPWEPPLESHAAGRLDARVQEIVDAARIPSGPVDIQLDDAGVVGIVGDREGALALARSLIAQACIHSGPADLTLGVFCDPGREADWEWASWLPHGRRLGGPTGQRWIAADRSRSNQLLRALRDGIDTHPTPAVVLLIDSDVLTEGRESPARAMLGHGRNRRRDSSRAPGAAVSGIVLASSAQQLPAACTVVIDVGEDARATVTHPGDLTSVDDVVLAGISVETAREHALALAHLEDPELIVPGAALPGLVRLPPLLELDHPSADKVLELWHTSRGVGTPIGVGESGSYSLDLVRDGPHGLVGGTTGSGKSEFLRTLVAGLAARNPPTRLTFILMDFKGGAAFSTCERLPHTIGTVSNLDEQLADRALRALEAEMDHRQRLFAAAGEGVDNLDAYLATNPEQPLPRLLLVVDEFAMLAKDYPEVLKSLVSVAAVGRTLGVHMILATQRPAGVVNDDILANTNLRVALRVQSRDDSNNVIGVPDASAIANSQKGRAYVKLGQDDITPVQTALVTGAVEEVDSTVVDVAELSLGIPVAPKERRRPPKDAPNDLDALIDAICRANEQEGFPPPRPVWPEPLDRRVDLTGFGRTSTDAGQPAIPQVGALTADGQLTFALSDDPDHQRQIGASWELGRSNLLLIGIPGYGTTTALTTIALGLAAQTSPEEMDLLVLDMGSRELAVLQDLPHTSAYVGSGAASREQQMRFLRHVRDELDRRRTATGRQRRMVYLIDGLAALREEFQDFEGLALLEGLFRAYVDGPELGMHFAVTTSRAKAIPAAIDEVTTQKWLFRLADAYDYSAGGIRPHQAPAAVPGRCVLAETRLQTHVATPAIGVPAAIDQIAAQWAGAPQKAPVVGQLPERITAGQLGVAARTSGDPWLVPVGLREADLKPHFLELYEGEHLMVAGPARSGKSSLLLAIAEALRAETPAVKIWGLCDRRSPLATAGLERIGVGADEAAALVAAARMQTSPVVLLIDDAERFDDGDQAIQGLLTAGLPHLHVIAAGRADDLRQLYSHWTKTLRRARCGVLLQPSVDYDGDLLAVVIPRHAPVALTTGRGYACMNGQAVLIQATSTHPGDLVT